MWRTRSSRRLPTTHNVFRISTRGAAQQLHSRIRTAITEITQRLWGDLPAEDLATAGRVLAIITERANAELAR